VPATSFVSREEELARLRDSLAVGPLVCLTGPAGCGKTRLALETARGWTGETRIAGLASAAPTDVSAIIAAALGLGYEAADLAMVARVAGGGADHAGRLGMRECVSEARRLARTQLNMEFAAVSAL
jgi:hypothetical protein